MKFLGYSVLPLILASSSPSRKTLLMRLGLPFDCYSPDVDETPLSQETPHNLAQRLAMQKAQVIGRKIPNALIIGSDTVVMADDYRLDKPLTLANARAQLTRVSGRAIICYTGLCLLNSQTHRQQTAVETYQVTFRHLDTELIDRYLIRDQPLHCAGSIKAENLGIALFSHTHGRDFTTLIGLPLIRLVDMLLHEGVRVI